MALHFNLKEVFLFCLGLMLWWFVLPYPLLGALGALTGLLVWKRKEISFADMIFAVVLLMNVWYVLSSMGNVRQYDYFNFVMHADYFVQNDFFIRSPKMYLQSVYFQPPLWGAIAGACAKVGMLLGVEQFNAGFDGVRFISLFCVSGVMILFWRLLHEFHFKKEISGLLFALFLSFPSNTIVANLVNNDAMVYFLMMAIMVVAVAWEREGRWQQAGLLFCAGMVKFSGLMILPAVGGLGLSRLFKAKNKLAFSLWGQFGLIGLGALLGFAWGILLLIHHLPLVPPPQDVSFQSMAEYRLVERLFSFERIGVPLVHMVKGTFEPNVWLSLLKTSLFGEWNWKGATFVWIVYILGGMLACCLVISFGSLLKYPLGRDYSFNLFCVILVFSVFISWINFWLDYPYFCSTEFRYVQILLPVGLLWFGNYLNQKNLPKVVYCALASFIGLFIFARFMLYLNTI